MDPLGQIAVTDGQRGLSGDFDAVPDDGNPLRRRRSLVGMIAMAVALLLTTAVVVKMTEQGEGPASAPAVESTAPVTTISSPIMSRPIPPPRPVPAVLADPSPAPQEFPMSIETFNEGVGAHLRHRSGGPYLTEAEVRQRALALTRCEEATARCDGAVVRFFPSYASAYQAFGASPWQYMGGFGHDREVYLVTVYGALPFCPRGPPMIGGGGCPIYRDHLNMVIDATTGEPS